jgi:hypothetical protein
MFLLLHSSIASAGTLELICAFNCMEISCSNSAGSMSGGVDDADDGSEDEDDDEGCDANVEGNGGEGDVDEGSDDVDDDNDVGPEVGALLSFS